MYASKPLKASLELLLVFATLTGSLIVGRNLAATSPKKSRVAGTASRSPAGPPNITPVAQSRILAAYGRLRLNFEPNQGQADAKAGYLARGSGYMLFLTPTEAVLSLRKEAPSGRTVSPRHHAAASEAEVSIHQQQPPHRNPQFATLHIGFKGANATPRVLGLDELPGKSNYLIGDDPSHWHTQIPNYAKVKYENVYPGIDLVYHGSQGQLEYDFIVAPGADPHAIRLSIQLASRVHLDSSGDLVARIGGSEIRQRPPRIYQAIGGAEKEIPGHYVLSREGEIGFEVDSYDRAKPLVIDPTMVYWTQLGGANGGEEGYAIAVDSSGNAWVAGSTSSNDFPTTPGVFQGSIGDTNCGSSGSGWCGDAFVTKLDVTGTAEIYSTFLGGNAQDQANAIAVDSGGNAYVAGLTYSTNFPTTSGAFQSKFGGGTCNPGAYSYPCPDAFVTVLNSTGTALIYSTYLGGSGADQGSGISVAPAGKVYVTGSAGSTDFPTTPGAFQTTFSASSAIFVSQIDPTQSGISSLVYSTFLGGDGSEGLDSGNGIAADSTGQAYLTGITWSPNFATPGSFQSVQPEMASAFVAKLNSLGSGLVYATYLGGSAAGCGVVNDTGNAIAIDSAGNAYVGGLASSHDFPSTPGAFQLAIKGSVNGFISKLNPKGTALIYSTLLGGSYKSAQCDMPPIEGVKGLAIDSAGDAYVTGSASSVDFPVTPDALEFNCSIFVDALQPCSSSFVTVVNPQGSSLVFSTFINGSTGIGSFAIAEDSSGGVYITGEGLANFPSVPGFSTVGNAFVAKISPTGVGPTVALSPTSLTVPDQPVGTSSPAQAVTLRNGGNASLMINTIATSGVFTQTNNCGSSLAATTSCTINVVFTPTSTSVFTGTLTITDSAFDSPQSIQLTGTGGTPSVSLSASSLTFASEPVGVTSASQRITMTNPGSAGLYITSIATTGDFAETNNCDSVLPSGSTCPIYVTFTPTVSGPRSGTLTITDNAANSPQTVAIGGTGSAPTLDLVVPSGSPSSATVQAGAMASYTLAIGGGGMSGTASLACTGAPMGAVCSVPTTVPVVSATASSFTVNVTTTSRTLSALRLIENHPGSWACAVFFLGIAIRPRARRKKRALLRLAWLIPLAVSLCSCGGGGNSTNPNGTPAGTYPLTVTATSGSTSQSVNLTLIVQ